MQQLAFLGAKLPSFRDAHEALRLLHHIQLTVKRVERITERIGGERVVERDAATAGWSRRPLMEKIAAPPGVQAPRLAAVLADGGRLQLRDKPVGATSHWREYKAAALHTLESQVHAHDPCPQVPRVFLQRERIDKLAREIARMAAQRETPESAVEESKTDTVAAEQPLLPVDDVGSDGYPPPQVLTRDVLASRYRSQDFGRQMAAEAWSRGFFGADRKAYVGDGQNWLWSEWEQHFKPYGFVPILDFVHALTHVYSAAMAGRTTVAGWPIYVRWIRHVWQGQVATVIADLAGRQQELGLPEAGDGETSPRTLVSKCLTYLQNQQSRMNYPAYRKQGLPITSAHMESTVKQLNRRVKGSEKFWSETGAEALLQLSADLLSTSQPLDKFWQTRPQRQPGHRTYTNPAA